VASLALCLCSTLAGQVASKLPPPFHSPSANNRPTVIERPDGARLEVPAGFKVTEFATGFVTPRFMILGPSNEILLSDSTAGKVYALVDKNKDNVADDRKELLSGLRRPYGLALHQGMLYVADEDAVRRYPYNAKAMSVGTGEAIVKLDGLQGGHWTRSLLFDTKNNQFYLGIGSASNVNAGEPEMRAAIVRFNADGSGKHIFASGTRNPIGLQFYPGTSHLWAAVQERDGLGDDLVPDYFIAVKDGGFYGWPYAYIGPNEDPRRKGERPDLVAKTITPDVSLGAHVAVLDFAFYQGKSFPAKYRGGAFLAFHGSWNRAQRVGYSVAFVPFANGKPSGPPEPFLSGWMLSPDKREVWGRPVAVLELKDGSLLVSDDGGRKVWRISYER
jgi:glucose/arabinose dehydrogenase